MIISFIFIICLIFFVAWSVKLFFSDFGNSLIELQRKDIKDSILKGEKDMLSIPRSLSIKKHKLNCLQISIEEALKTAHHSIKIICDKKFSDMFNHESFYNILKSLYKNNSNIDIQVIINTCEPPANKFFDELIAKGVPMAYLDFKNYSQSNAILIDNTIVIKEISNNYLFYIKFKDEISSINDFFNYIF